MRRSTQASLLAGLLLAAAAAAAQTAAAPPSDAPVAACVDTLLAQMTLVR